jgi:hypothetical protein
MKVCPNSAKLNLQVAKLRLNEGNATGARVHVDIAKKIDPNFCDIEFQDAVIMIMHENKLEEGIQLLSKNLRCVYTNTEALNALQVIYIYIYYICIMYIIYIYIYIVICFLCIYYKIYYIIYI